MRVEVVQEGVAQLVLDTRGLTVERAELHEDGKQPTPLEYSLADAHEVCVHVDTDPEFKPYSASCLYQHFCVLLHVANCRHQVCPCYICSCSMVAVGAASMLIKTCPDEHA